ncbi:hypothetical protein KR018_009031 [Drosophila ironensis]|nr:hypothetical protein KR018_009031 [Drosophila ironensis]
MFRLLLLWITLGLAVALDEREFDPLVAPPAVPKPFQLWRSFASQLRMVFNRLKYQTTAPPPAPAPPTVRIRMRTTSTTSEPQLQFYGALNPIFQTGNF